MIKGEIKNQLTLYSILEKDQNFSLQNGLVLNPYINRKSNLQILELARQISFLKKGMFFHLSLGMW